MTDWDDLSMRQKFGVFAGLAAGVGAYLWLTIAGTIFLFQAGFVYFCWLFCVVLTCGLVGAGIAFAVHLDGDL